MAALVVLGGCGEGEVPTLTIAAAADLSGPSKDLARAFKAETGTDVVFDLGSSGQLSQQIEAGAPVDVFMAADRSYVQGLVDKGLVDASDADPYARGELVIWVRDDGPADVDELVDLTDPRVTRIAIANPAHAPYGKAAQQALEAAGIWSQVQPKLVMGENVLQALQFAESGNADAAIVAASVAHGAGGRTGAVPEDTFTPLIQTLGVLKGSTHLAEARTFAEFMRGPEAQAILATYGFAPAG